MAEADAFADPFVLRVADGYVAYGTGPVLGSGRVVEAMTSADLVHWQRRGRVLERLPAEFGDEYWAPEVAYADGEYWMYYSVGRGVDGHHLRVASATDPLGPFTDAGVNLTSGERFAIDAHPFRDSDGQWYLFYARDVLDSARPGTHLAVAPMVSMTELGPSVSVLEPTADWQLYERGRSMYGATYDWHTIEGPSVVLRAGRYWLTYSGGAWTGPGYGVTWAVADSPLGPWSPAPSGAPLILATGADLIGPGHNSIVTAADGGDVIAFHSWDAAGTARTMRLRRIAFEPEGPRVDGPIRGPFIRGAASARSGAG